MCFHGDVIKQSSFPSKQGKNSKRSHCFPPMNRDHRRLIHDLAQVYGLESVSYDSEPKRNVVVTAIRWVDLAVTGRTVRRAHRTQGAECVGICSPPLEQGKGKPASLGQSFLDTVRSELGSRGQASRLEMQRPEMPAPLPGRYQVPEPHLCPVSPLVCCASLQLLLAPSY